MAERSKIEWTTATANFWRGCDKVSPGCAHCYMFTAQERYGRDPSVVVRTADSTFYAPVRQKKWRDLPAGSMVFTCSWSDFFHKDADEWRDDAWEVIRQRPDLNWQILTKRPELIAERLPSDWGDGWANVWLGVSIENWRFNHRADQLRDIPAAIRFISAEPLLGPLITPRNFYGQSLDLTDIDWLIVGGESGPIHRRMDLRWVRALRDACTRTGHLCERCNGNGTVVIRHARTNYMGCPDCQLPGGRPNGIAGRTAFFLKQLGGPHSGTKLEDLPPDLRIREYPQHELSLELT